MSALAALVAVLVLCLVLSALFTALESAYKAPPAAGGAPADGAVVEIRPEPREQRLNALGLGNLAMDVGAASAATLAVRILSGGDPGAAAWGGLVLGLTLVLLIPCEMVPQRLGTRDPAATIRRWGPWAAPWFLVARPVAALLTRLSAAVRRAVSGGMRAARLTSQDVLSAVESAEEHRALESEERDMVHSIFSFGQTTVREVMVPRPDMVVVEDGLSIPEILQVAREAEHSRLPVHRGSRDEVVGIIHVKDLLARRYGLDGDAGPEGLVREAFYVPESKRIDDLLREFQAQGAHMAIVVDEYGGTAGLVTIEDILEEIVGEIQDEHDLEEPLYTQQPDGSVLVDARMDLDDFGEVLGTRLEGEGFETVGGLVYALLGRVPEEGEEVTSGGWAFRVVRLEGRRIVKLRVARLPAPAAAPSARDAEEGR